MSRENREKLVNALCDEVKAVIEMSSISDLIVNTIRGSITELGRHLEEDLSLIVDVVNNCSAEIQRKDLKIRGLEAQIEDLKQRVQRLIEGNCMLFI